MTSSSVASAAIIAFGTAACVPGGTCGDGELDVDEGCDDRNVDDGDGCTNSCVPRCGGANLIDILLVIHADCADRARWAGALDDLSRGIENANPVADVRIATTVPEGMGWALGPYRFASGTILGDPTSACTTDDALNCGALPSEAVTDLMDSAERASFQCLTMTVPTSPGGLGPQGDPVQLCMLSEPYRDPYPGDPVDTGEFGRSDAIRAFLLVSNLEDCSVYVDSGGDNDCEWYGTFNGGLCLYYQGGADDVTEVASFGRFVDTMTSTEPSFFAALIGMDENGISDGTPLKSGQWVEACSSELGFTATPAPRLAAVAESFGAEASYLASYCDDDVGAHFEEIGRRLAALSSPCPDAITPTGGCSCRVAGMRRTEASQSEGLLMLVLATLLGLAIRRRHEHH